MKLTPGEQETVIRFDREDPKAVIYTADRTVYERLKRSGLEPVKIHKAGREVTGWEFEVNRQAVRIKEGTRAVKLSG